jgi:branched-chain amino acid transport system ATP-binding protein
MSAVLAESPGPRDAPVSASLLEAIGLGRRFRGLAAVDNVSIDVCVGEIHAVIGTNGAGKSTLINMLSGELAPSAGTVRFAGHDVTRWPQPRRARAGLGRSYQRTTIFAEFSVLENCRLAAQARYAAPWRWWEDASRCAECLDAARAAISRAGLADAMDRSAGSLSHGEKRQLEIAGVAVDARQIELKDAVKAVGKHEALVRLPAGTTATLKFWVTAKTKE